MGRRRRKVDGFFIFFIVVAVLAALYGATMIWAVVTGRVPLWVLFVH